MSSIVFRDIIKFNFWSSMGFLLSGDKIWFHFYDTESNNNRNSGKESKRNSKFSNRLEKSFSMFWNLRGILYQYESILYKHFTYFERGKKTQYIGKKYSLIQGHCACTETLFPHFLKNSLKASLEKLIEVCHKGINLRGYCREN